jgi:hypothetical protein
MMVTVATIVKTSSTPRMLAYTKIAKNSSESHSTGSMNQSLPRSSNGLGRPKM